MTAVAVVETGLICGIARFVGMDTLDAPGATGGVDTDYASIADTLARALQQYDFVLCNVKATPTCAGTTATRTSKRKSSSRLTAWSHSCWRPTASRST